MEILSVVKRVASVTGMAVPEVVFGSTDRTAIELATVANRAAETIASEHDWQRLRRIATITGDGTTQAWDLPNDYSRIPEGTTLRWAEGELPHVVDHDLWLDWQVRDWNPTYGAWTLIGDRMEILPVLPAGKVVKYWYQSDRIVRSDGTAANSSFPYNLSFELADSDAYGYAQTQFLRDTDHFQLPWNLLELGMIWQWKANKHLPYAEDLQNYELEKARAVKRERGPRVVTVGGAHCVDDAEIAYPRTLIG